MNDEICMYDVVMIFDKVDDEVEFELGVIHAIDEYGDYEIYTDEGDILTDLYSKKNNNVVKVGAI